MDGVDGLMKCQNSFVLLASSILRRKTRVDIDAISDFRFRNTQDVAAGSRSDTVLVFFPISGLLVVTEEDTYLPFFYCPASSAVVLNE